MVGSYAESDMYNMAGSMRQSINLCDQYGIGSIHGGTETGTYQKSDFRDIEFGQESHHLGSS